MKNLLFTLILCAIGSALMAQAPDVESVKICRENDLIYNDYHEAVFLDDKKTIFAGRGNYMEPDIVAPMIEMIGSDGVSLGREYLDTPYFRPIIDIVATSDGGFVYATDYRDDPEFNDQIEITKADADGIVQWSQRFSGDSLAAVKAIAQTASGGYVAVGYVLEGIRSKSFILNLDSSGDSLWMETYSIADVYVGGFDVCETGAGDFLVAGLYNFSELLVLKYSSSGEFQWVNHFDEFQSGQYELEIVRMTDGDFCIGANTALVGGTTPIMLMKIQADGDTLWTREYTESSNLWLGGLYPTTDNGILMTAKYWNDDETQVYLGKAEGNGDPAWSGLYHYVRGEPMPLAVKQDGDGSITIAGSTNIDLLGVESFLLKFQGAATSVDFDDGAVYPEQFALSQSYPNPFNAGTTIAYSVPSRAFVTIEIFNVLGQSVLTLVDEKQPAGKYSVQWDGLDDSGNEVASGVYFYKLTIDDITQTRKMMLLK